MLQITIPDREFLSDDNEFFTIKGAKLTLEHSLISISKWEALHKKAFFSNESMTIQDTIDYIKCMTLTQNVDPIVYSLLTSENIKEIQEYIDDPMTATTFSEQDSYVKRSRKTKKITSEEIYYYMVSFNIPFECEKWHINRLMALIRICDIKSRPPKKRSKKASLDYMNQLNNARRQSLGTRG